MKWMLAVVLFTFMITLADAKPILAEETDEKLLELLDFTKADQMLTENGQNKGIKETAKELMSNEEDGFLGSLAEKIKDTLTNEFLNQKNSWLALIGLSFLSAFLVNFMNTFSSGNFFESSHLILYLAVMGLLFETFLRISQMAGAFLSCTSDFMKYVLPSLMIAVGIASGHLSSVGFYEIAFGVIACGNWIFTSLLLPLVQVYVSISIINGISKEDIFSKTAEVIENIVNWVLKSMIGIVVGLNLIKGMILPSVDAFRNSSVGKMASLIPGIGSGASAVTELFIGSGRIIKNGIGAAVLLGLVSLCVIPLLRLLLFSLLYQITSAVLQPVTNKQMTESIMATAKGAGLLLKILITEFVLFFLTVSLICILTNLSG